MLSVGGAQHREMYGKILMQFLKSLYFPTWTFTECKSEEEQLLCYRKKSGGSLCELSKEQ